METLCENKFNLASGRGKEMGGREKRRRKTEGNIRSSVTVVRECR